MGKLKKTVSQGALAMINMSNDAEITDILQGDQFSGHKNSMFVKQKKILFACIHHSTARQNVQVLM